MLATQPFTFVYLNCFISCPSSFGHFLIPVPIYLAKLSTGILWCLRLKAISPSSGHLLAGSGQLHSVGASVPTRFVR